MANFAAILFGLFVASYIGFLIFGLVQVWPWGIIGIAFLTGIGILFFGVCKQRLGNKEDDHYSNNVEK